MKPNRRTGSPGNREATDFVVQTMRPWGYAIDAVPFACLDWAGEKPSLASDGTSFETHISPYSPGCRVTAELKTVSTLDELKKSFCAGRILLMKNEICAEQLMPKNFVFYNPEQHQEIYALLEEKQPAAVITATRKQSQSAGALYPLPMIEDGDFDIPSLYCAETVGDRIAARTGETFTLKADAERIPSNASNVIARKNPDAETRIVVCAHIDAYGDSPGACDNASGMSALMLLAEMLRDYRGSSGIDLIAFNGEDNYSAAGQMDYLKRYGNKLDQVKLAVNLDGIGYIKGETAYSFYQCADDTKRQARLSLGEFRGLIEGPPWYQGDHMIFVQHGRQAVALTTESAGEVTSTIAHTAADRPELVETDKLVETAEALAGFVRQYCS